MKKTDFDLSLCRILEALYHEKRLALEEYQTHTDNENLQGYIEGINSCINIIIEQYEEEQEE